MSIEFALTLITAYAAFMTKEHMILLAQFAEMLACGSVFYAACYGRESLMFVYLVFNVSGDRRRFEISMSDRINMIFRPWKWPTCN